nr:alkaline phosphatase PhoX [Streptomyces sp. AA0539]
MSVQRRPVFPASDPDEVSSNPSANRPFHEVAAARFSRRSVLASGAVAAAAGFLTGSTGTAHATAATASPPEPTGRRPTLGFTPVPTSDADRLTLPEGYQAQVIIPWGTPIRPGGPAWRKDAANSAAEQAQQVGMNHDGMHFFPLGKGAERNRRGLLVLNHEYIDQQLLFPDGDAEMTREKVAKATAAHGVSIVELVHTDRHGWQVADSPRARRVTADTPVTFSGPVGPRHPALRAADPPRGTINNCSHGVTPWGTYLACEENFNAYFGTEHPGWEPTDLQARYGIDREGFGYRWHEADPRFDIAVNPHEANRFGWVVEIDPMDPDAVPVKRTALGRIKHEGCVTTEARGRIVAYTGDDQDGDYLYKFVGDGSWRAHRARGRSPLDHGTLYVARFEDDGTGRWLPLTHGTGPLTRDAGWADQADVLLRTREAADALGATPMDRPEWIAVNPVNQDVYCSLTNGSGRGGAANPVPQPVRAHHPLARARRRQHRHHLHLGHLPAGRRPGVRGAHRPHRGHPLRLTRRPVVRPGRPAVDPHRRLQLLAEPAGEGLRPHRQQPDAGRRPAHRRDPPLSHRPARLRDHRRDHHPRPAHHVRQRPAPRRGHPRLGGTHPGEPPGRQQLARLRPGGPPPLRHHRHPPHRRRRHRSLTTRPYPPATLPHRPPSRAGERAGRSHR